MERKALKVGMKVGVLSASLTRTLEPREATVERLLDLPGYRRNRAEVRYADTGTLVSLPLRRIVKLTS